MRRRPDTAWWQDAGVVHIIRATTADVPDVLALLDDASTWPADAGIQQ